MAPLETRLRAAVAARLNTGFEAVTIVCWKPDAKGWPVPVFGVPHELRDIAASLGLDVARPERVTA